jgi:hypothetical protein
MFMLSYHIKKTMCQRDAILNMEENKNPGQSGRAVIPRQFESMQNFPLYQKRCCYEENAVTI